MIEYLFKKNYLTMIENAARSENWMFRNFYIVQDGVEKDALENGGLSCAVFVSSILYLHNSLLEFLKKPQWINFTHANTDSTVRDMLKNGWQEIQDLRVGAVILWGESKFDNGNHHKHLGFYTDNNEVISHSASKQSPQKHPLVFNDAGIEKILWHPELDDQ